MTKLEELQKLLLAKGMTEEEFELMMPFLMGAFNKYLFAEIFNTIPGDELEDAFKQMESFQMSFSNKLEYMDKRLQEMGNVPVREIYEQFLQKLINAIADVSSVLMDIAKKVEEFPSPKSKKAETRKLINEAYNSKMKDFESLLQSPTNNLD